MNGFIGETPYDLRWWMFGIHVRVHPFFWVMGAVLSWSLLVHFGIVHFLIAIACIFVSILLHELGHVVAGNWFGSRGHIVLWAFGGLAVGSTHLRSRWQRIAVTFAGPFVQLVLFGLLWLAQKYLLPPDLLLTNEYVWIALVVLLYINLWWALLNLLPIWPLDGGQIARELFVWFAPRGGVRHSLYLSITVCVLLALGGLLARQLENPPDFLRYVAGSPIFFGLFALFGIQALQAENARARWVDEHAYWDDEFR